MIDSTDVGFISINQFSAGIDRVIKLSQPAKDGFFAYLDKQKIGLVDPKDVLKILKKTAIDKNIDVTEDNFDWQNDVIKKIREWTRDKKLNAEVAYRIIDTDFDGFISKNDLTNFLREVLKLPKDDVTSPRIDRLFKLLDVFKRGAIQFNDIRRLLQEDIDYGNNATISGGKTLIGRNTFDWRIHAKQQIGLVLSKKFPTLENSFEVISSHTMKMTYKHFATWIEEARALTGFNLTEKLLQQLFADLDPHKKGHLTQNDWENAFGGYSADGQMMTEVQDVLNTNFAGIQEAFDYFCDFEKTNLSLVKEVSLNAFKTSINALLPKRFDLSEINWLWNKSAGAAETMDFNKFTLAFDNKKFTGLKKVTMGVAKTATEPSVFNRSFDGTSISKDRKALLTNTLSRNVLVAGLVATKKDIQDRVVDKVKQIMNASNMSIQDFYKQMDTDGSGEVNNLEFINGVKKLKLGLTLKEIDELVTYCDQNQDGKVSFNEFSKKFQPTQSDVRIFDRSKNKLKQIKDNIYSYMLSPKDAFLQYNEDRTGKLTYAQFNKLIAALCTLSREDVPSFSIIKDLFDFIDIRRDGIIDMSEWMQSFRLIESDNNPGAKFMQKRPNTVQVSSLLSKPGEFQNGTPRGQKVQSAGNTATKERFRSATPTLITSMSALSQWECTKEYEDVMKIIGRNRKVLISSFSDMSKSGSLTFERVRDVLIELLRNNSIAINESYWPYLLKVAERDSAIDYKFLLEVFKERSQLLVAHPKASILQFN
jgi:Ca2+-binding EF-hand superfamily protein